MAEIGLIPFLIPCLSHPSHLSASNADLRVKSLLLAGGDLGAIPRFEPGPWGRGGRGGWVHPDLNEQLVKERRLWQVK